MIPFVLSLLVFLPILSGIAILMLARDARDAKYGALAASLAELAVGLYVCFDFVTTGKAQDGLWQFQYVESAPWVPSIGITYTLGLDSLSFAMLLLTVLVFPPAVLFAFSEHHDLHKFFALLLAMEGAILGVFFAEDFFLFYIFWEAVLIPMFFL